METIRFDLIERDAWEIAMYIKDAQTWLSQKSIQSKVCSEEELMMINRRLEEAQDKLDRLRKALDGFDRYIQPREKKEG